MFLEIVLMSSDFLIQLFIIPFKININKIPNKASVFFMTYV